MLLADDDKLKVFPALVNDLEVAIYLLAQIGGGIDTDSEFWPRVGHMKVTLDQAKGLNPLHMDHNDDQYKQQHGIAVEHIKIKAKEYTL